MYTIDISEEDYRLISETFLHAGKRVDRIKTGEDRFKLHFNDSSEVVVVDRGLVIDKEDYNVVREIFPEHSAVSQNVVTVDEKHRIVRLSCDPLYSSSSGSTEPSIPHSIGKLTSLKRLNLSGLKNLEHIPSTIWGLENLEHLDLRGTANLKELPKEVGDMVKLKALILSGSKINSLPSSIGKLRNLELLELSSLKSLKDLPDETWNLASLTSFEMDFSSIKSLPSSIGRLLKLKHLILKFNTFIFDLPKEIGNLTDLTTLNLEYSLITKFPHFLGKLQNLTYLNLQKTKISENRPYSCAPEDLLQLATQSRSLGWISADFHNFSDPTNMAKKTAWELACNRARVQLHRQPEPFPSILFDPTSAYDLKNVCVSETFSTLNRTIRYSDAVYNLLVEGREAFVRFLIGRSNDMQRVRAVRRILTQSQFVKEQLPRENESSDLKNTAVKPKRKTKDSTDRGNNEADVPPKDSNSPKKHNR